MSTFEWQRSPQGVLAADKVYTLRQFVQHRSAHACHDPHTGHHVRRVCHLEGHRKDLSPAATASWNHGRIATIRYLDAVFGQSRSHGTHTEGNHVHGPTCRDRNSRRCRVTVRTHLRGHTVPAMHPGKRSSRALCQSLSLIQLPS